MKRGILILVAVGLAALVACGGKEGARGPQGPAAKATLVEAALADLPSAEAYVGNVRSQQAVTVSTKMMGRVLSIAVQEGEAVKRGQLLLEVDAAEAQSAYRQSKAGVEAAEIAAANAARDLERFRALYEQKAVTRHQLEQVEAGAAGARAQKAQAEANLGMSQTLLSYGKIVAPMDGVITKKWVDVGNLAYPGAPILTLEDPSRLELSVQVPEEKSRGLAAGQGASVTVDALGKSFDTTVTAVVGAADPMSRTSTVKLGLPGDAGAVPGQFARVRFAAFGQSALAVPQEAVVARGQMDALFVADGGVARMRYVQTGMRAGGKVQILAGLKEGESVVSPVPAGLSDGTRLEAAP